MKWSLDLTVQEIADQWKDSFELRSKADSILSRRKYDFLSLKGVEISWVKLFETEKLCEPRLLIKIGRYKNSFWKRHFCAYGGDYNRNLPMKYVSIMANAFLFKYVAKHTTSLD